MSEQAKHETKIEIDALNRAASTQPETLRTPAEQGSINLMVSSAVKEALLAMGPIFASLALTPEKIREANKPYVDEKAVLREARERRLMKEDFDEAERTKKLAQKNCPRGHKDDNGRYAVALIHNYPDRQARGICTHCHLLIEPSHWEIVAPTEKHPRGEPRLVPASPLYHIVQEVQASNGQM